MIARRMGCYTENAETPLYSGFSNMGITITDGWAEGSADHYLQLPVPPLQTAGVWEWKIRMIMTGVRTNSDSYLIGFPYGYEYKAPTFGFLDDTKHMMAALSSNGYSWDLGVPNLALNPTLNVTYDLKFGFNGSAYYLKHRLLDEADYTTDSTFSSSTKCYCSASPILLNCGHNRSNVYWRGSMDLNNTSIRIDDVLWWRAYE